jgi:hypothetical protein
LQRLVLLQQPAATKVHLNWLPRHLLGQMCCLSNIYPAHQISANVSPSSSNDQMQLSASTKKQE